MQTTQQLMTAGIRYRLAILGKPQAWLAKEIGISSFALSRRMSGRTHFDVELGDEIATALGTDFPSLISLPQMAEQSLAA
jgi:hypothetical protein